MRPGGHGRKLGELLLQTRPERLERNHSDLLPRQLTRWPSSGAGSISRERDVDHLVTPNADLTEFTITGTGALDALMNQYFRVPKAMVTPAGSASRRPRTRAPGLLAPPICGAGLAILAGRPHNEA